MDRVEIVRTCTWPISPKPEILASEGVVLPASTWVSEGDAVSGQVRFCGGFGRTDVAVAHSLHSFNNATIVNHLGCHDCERFREHDSVPLVGTSGT